MSTASTKRKSPPKYYFVDAKLKYFWKGALYQKKMYNIQFRYSVKKYSTAKRASSQERIVRHWWRTIQGCIPRFYVGGKENTPPSLPSTPTLYSLSSYRLFRPQAQVHCRAVVQTGLWLLLWPTSSTRKCLRRQPRPCNVVFLSLTKCCRTLLSWSLDIITCKTDPRDPVCQSPLRLL